MRTTALFAALALAAGEPVVTVKTSEPVVPRGGKIEARVTVTVKDGFHVQANPASEPYLIPLQLELAGAGPIRVGDLIYPPGVPYRLQGATTDLSTYEGTFDLRVPLEAAKDAATGNVSVSGTLKYQACNDRLCLKPATLPVMLTVRVADKPARPICASLAAPS